MATYLQHKFDGENSLRGKKVLELGSGCGLSGMVAAILGGAVTFTDIHKLLPWLQKNVSSNLHDIDYSIEVLEWGKVRHNEQKIKYDVILGTDLVYNKKLIGPLLKTTHRMSTMDTLILFAFEMHEPSATKKFWDTVGTYFIVDEIPPSEWNYSSKQNAPLFLVSMRKKALSGDYPSDSDFSDDSESSYEED